MRWQEAVLSQAEHTQLREKRLIIGGFQCSHDVLYLGVFTSFSIGNVHKASTIKLPVNHFFPDSFYQQHLRDKTFSR